MSGGVESEYLADASEAETVAHVALVFLIVFVYALGGVEAAWDLDGVLADGAEGVKFVVAHWIVGSLVVGQCL